MNFGFIINNTACIGCHACSTACKSENEVPLGVARTWVKSVETGVYPNVRRSFQVTRCNHCANPPCVRICPVQAMYQRADGIVEFDPEQCIGCKACLQACPYDAIYVDPSNGTAAKCHYCSHRTELGLEPACVVVCPEHAIIAGDLDDPASEINRILAENQVTVRKPEQGTAPKLFYIAGEDVSLHPTAKSSRPDTFAWVDVNPASSTYGGNHGPSGDGSASGALPDMALPVVARTTKRGVPVRAPKTQGLPEGGAVLIGDSRMADQMTQVVYNNQHKIPWHWPVPAYLVTKGIAAGIFMLLSLGSGLGFFGFEPVPFLAAGFATVLFLLLTTAFLVIDLERPERFLRIVFQPQMKSWLTRGAFVLIGFSTLAGLWWVIELGAYLDIVPTGLAEGIRPFALWIGLPFALGTAIYTAFLFGQAEGRDLWQSALLPIHLIVQAFMMGGAAMLILALFVEMTPELVQVAQVTFLVALVVDLLVTLLGEFSMPHASEAAARAAHEISHGKYAGSFWWGSIVVGHVVAFVLALFPGVAWLPAAGGLLAIVGLYLYEHAFVMAPQEIPNS